MTSKGKNDKTREDGSRTVREDAPRAHRSAPKKAGNLTIDDPLHRIPEFEASDESISVLLDTMMDEQEKTQVSRPIPPQPFRRPEPEEPKRRSSWYPPYEPIHATLDESYLLDDEPVFDDALKPSGDDDATTQEGFPPAEEPATHEDEAPSGGSENDGFAIGEQTRQVLAALEEERREQELGRPFAAEEEREVLEEVELGFDDEEAAEEPDSLDAEASLDAEYLFGDESSFDDRGSLDDEESFDDTEETTELSLFDNDDDDTMSVSMSIGADKEPLFTEEKTRRVVMDPSLLERSKEGDVVELRQVLETEEPSEDEYSSDDEVILASFTHGNRAEAGSSVSLVRKEQPVGSDESASGVGGYIRVGRSDDEHSVVEVEARVKPVAVDVVELTRTVLTSVPIESPRTAADSWTPLSDDPAQRPSLPPSPSLTATEQVPTNRADVPKTRRFGSPTLAIVIVASLALGATVGLAFAYFGPVSQGRSSDSHPRVGGTKRGSPQLGNSPPAGTTTLPDEQVEEDGVLMLIPSVEIIAPARAEEEGGDTELANAAEEPAAIESPNEEEAGSAPEAESPAAVRPTPTLPRIDNVGGLPAGVTVLPEQVLLPIVFLPGESRPAGVDQAEIQRITAIMANDRSFQVELIGHATVEEVMPSWRARQLARQRAEAVVDVMRAHGPSRRRFLPRGAREDEILPIATGLDGPRRAVVLKVMPPAPEPFRQPEVELDPGESPEAGAQETQ